MGDEDRRQTFKTNKEEKFDVKQILINALGTGDICA
jgi:hypothetical protein